MKKYRKPLDYLAIAMNRARRGNAEGAVKALFAAAVHSDALDTIALIERSQAHALKADAEARAAALKAKAKKVKAADEDDADADIDLDIDPDVDDDGDADDVDLDINIDSDDDDVPEEVDSKARAAFAKLLKGMK